MRFYDTISPGWKKFINISASDSLVETLQRWSVTLVVKHYLDSITDLYFHFHVAKMWWYGYKVCKHNQPISCCCLVRVTWKIMGHILKQAQITSFVCTCMQPRFDNLLFTIKAISRLEHNLCVCVCAHVCLSVCQ